jgi:carboxylesterase
MCDQVYVAGISMGGVLTLIAANRYQVQGVAALSTPYGLTSDWRVHLMRPLSLFVPKFKKPAAVGNRAETSYAYFVPHAIAEAAELAKLMQESLTKINIPVLLIQSRGDKVIEPNALDLISGQLHRLHPETLWLEKSGHIITLDQEREIVYRKVADFFTTIT